MNLYVVKNDSEEYYDSRYGWNHSSQHVWKNRDDAEIVTAIVGGHVVPLVEAPAKVVVSAEEAEMLEWNKSRLAEAKPAANISGYIAGHKHDYGSHNSALDEDRLMRAYVNGYTVAKEKKYNVKVPHTKDAWYYKSIDSNLWTICPEDKKLRGTFTEAEIEHYGLQDCERVEVTDDGIR